MRTLQLSYCVYTDPAPFLECARSNPVVIARSNERQILRAMFGQRERWQMLDTRLVAVPTETERYIRFQLEHLTARNEHHTFEEICYRIAERRLSSNILPATGPVGAGG